MQNADIHIYKTRDFEWKARISHSGKVEYIDRCPTIPMLMEQIERALLLRS